MIFPKDPSRGAHVLAEVSRHEIWRVRGRERICLERRLDEGISRASERSPELIQGLSDLGRSRGWARLPRDVVRALRLATARPAREIVDRIATKAEGNAATIRILTVARSVQRDRQWHSWARAHVGVELSRNGVVRSILSTNETLDDDMALLLADAPPTVSDADPREVPLLWTGGTAAVLFHEAIGHPATAGAPSVPWPYWLEVEDDPGAPGLGCLDVDDVGLVPDKSVLTRGERPCSWRRESWRDAPARRMSNLIVSANGPGRVRPSRRIEIRLVHGGSWDPLTDEVTIHVAVAELVARGRRLAIPPFTIREPRARIARSLEAGRGSPARYPGVTCHDEGQRIAVGSFAPDILTRPLAR